jgi:hypothetical protein
MVTHRLNGNCDCEITIDDGTHAAISNNKPERAKALAHYVAYDLAGMRQGHEEEIEAEASKGWEPSNH